MKKKKGIDRIIEPIRIDFGFQDFLQVVIGASILAVPVGFTEETWNLGSSLPLTNIFILMGLTLFFIGIFTYSHYHRKLMHENPKHHTIELVKRIFITYIVSFALVAFLLWIIQVTPWETDATLAFKRVALVTFPSALGAAVSDVIK